jgi:hypothetical protein
MSARKSVSRRVRTPKAPNGGNQSVTEKPFHPLYGNMKGLRYARRRFSSMSRAISANQSAIRQAA